MKVCTLWFEDEDNGIQRVNIEKEVENVLDFGTVLVQEQATRSLELRNDCPFHVPFTLESSHPEFICEPQSGMVPPNGRSPLKILFHPVDSFDSSMSNNGTSLKINIMYGLMGSYSFVLRARTREFLFNARLLGPIEFQSCFVGNNSTKMLILQNNRKESIDYELTVKSLSDSFFTKIRGGEGTYDKNKGTVDAGNEVEIAVTFCPKADGDVEGAIIISTVEGDFTVNLTAQGVSCEMLVEPQHDINFGCVGIGFEKDASLVVTNQSTLAITVSPTIIAEPGSNGSAFHMEKDLGKQCTIQPQESTTFAIRFLPTLLDDDYCARLRIDASMGNQDFQMLNPTSLQSITLEGTSGVIDLKLNPIKGLDIGSIPCVMPQSFTITLVNSGNVNISVIATDVNGKPLSGAGVSFYGRGVLSMSPHVMELAAGECKSVTITAVMRKPGQFELPIHFSLIDFSGEKTWPYTIRGIAKKPLVSSQVLEILELENLPMLHPVLPFKRSIEMENVINPVVVAGSASDPMNLLTEPIAPASWIQQDSKNMLGSIRIPEPALPSSIVYREFRRELDGRKALKYNASASQETNDMIWRSLRKNSASGIF